MNKVLDICKKEQNDIIILELAGRLDTSGARLLEEYIGKEPEQYHNSIILDMQKVGFLSSAGIRVLIKYYKLCKESDGTFILKNVPPQSAEILKMVGLEQLIPSNQINKAEATRQESTSDNLYIEWWQLHNEPAEIINTAISKHSVIRPYEIGIGRQKGEFMTLGNQTIPQDITGEFSPEYYTGTNGSPSHFIQFRCMHHPATLEEITSHLLKATETESCTIVYIAQSAGVIGCMQKDKPFLPSHPVFYTNPLLITGTISALFAPYTRPLSKNSPLSGHFHAAVYSPAHSRMIEKDLHQALQNLSANLTRPEAFFHLLNDERTVEGIGQTRLSDGSAWIIKIK